MEGWQDAFVPDAMHMLDYADENGYRQRSASFIDAVIVQDTLGGGRILLLADAWAWNGGLFQHLADASGGTEMRSVARGDGFCTIGAKNIFCFPTRTGRGTPTGRRGISTKTQTGAVLTTLRISTARRTKTAVTRSTI